MAENGRGTPREVNRLRATRHGGARNAVWEIRKAVFHLPVPAASAKRGMLAFRDFELIFREAVVGFVY